MYYMPDEWIIVKMNDVETHYRVFGSIIGGFVTAVSWRMNSGIISVEQEDDFYNFSGHSGSIYKCDKNCYGINSSHNYGVLMHYKDILKDKFVILTDLPDVLNMDWLLKKD